MTNCVCMDDQLMTIFENCFDGKHPTTDKDMYIFYAATNMLQKAITQSSASILLEDDVNEDWFRTYVQQHEATLKKISDAFHHYIFQVKGYNDEHYFDEWKKGMEQLASDREKWKEEMHSCYTTLHSILMQSKNLRK